MYSRGSTGWDVVGRVQGDWTVRRGDQDLNQDSGGRFSFSVPSLAETAVSLCRPGLEVEIPSAEEVGSGGTSSAG